MLICDRMPNTKTYSTVYHLSNWTIATVLSEIKRSSLLLVFLCLAADLLLGLICCLAQVLTIGEAVVVCLDDALDAPALRLARVAVQREAVAHAPVEQPAEAQRDEPLV